MKRGSYLTKAQREELLKVYLEQGLQAAKPLAAAFNVHPKYCAKLARKRGLRAVVKTRGIRTTFKDRRWEWAIQRGAVSV